MLNCVFQICVHLKSKSKFRYLHIVHCASPPKDNSLFLASFCQVDQWRAATRHPSRIPPVFAKELKVKFLETQRVFGRMKTNIIQHLFRNTMCHQKKGNPSNTFTHISLCGKDRVVWIDEVGNVTSILVKPSMWRLDIWLKETTFRNIWNVWHFVEMIFVEEKRSPQASSFLQASESAESWKHKKELD